LTLVTVEDNVVVSLSEVYATEITNARSNYVPGRT